MSYAVFSAQSIAQQKNKINIFFEDKSILSIPPVWLRYHCQCEKCFHQLTGQKLIPAYLADEALEVKSMHLSPDKLKLTIEWQDFHVSQFELNYLLTYFKETHGVKNNYLKGTKDFFNKCSMEYTSLLKHPNVNKALCLLNHYGLLLIKGTPCTNGMVVQVANIFSPIMKTIYGDLFNVKVEENPINVAYTALPLELHIDLAYYESPPGLQLLHCIAFDKDIEGGESTFLDGFWAAEELRRQNPEAFHTLCTIPATFQKIHYTRQSPVDILYSRTHIVVNNNEEIIALNWAPPFEGSPRIPINEIERYYQAYRHFAKLINDYQPEQGVTFHLQAGDLIIFNNRRWLHGRRGFSLAKKTSTRHLQGTYISSDDFLSACRIAYHENPLEWQNLQRIGNNDLF